MLTELFKIHLLLCLDNEFQGPIQLLFEGNFNFFDPCFCSSYEEHTMSEVNVHMDSSMSHSEIAVILLSLF